jgi:hypothetical protein
VIVRLLLWNLADSKTSLDELRPRLPESEHRTWISHADTDRFGVIEHWEDAPEDFPRELLDLIGADPVLYEEFDVEA